MFAEVLKDKLSDFCNSLFRANYKKTDRHNLVVLLKMTENLRNILIEKINAVDRQKTN